MKGRFQRFKAPKSNLSEAVNADLSRPVEQLSNRNLRTLDFVASSGTQFQAQVANFERNPKFKQVQVAESAFARLCQTSTTFVQQMDVLDCSWHSHTHVGFQERTAYCPSKQVPRRYVDSGPSCACVFVLFPCGHPLKNGVNRFHTPARL